MKKQLIYFLLALTAVCLGACNNDDEIDTAHSIFSTEPVERNAFDDWLLDNYTYPYNIDFMYRMKDIESDHKYNLVPADYDKAVALSKIIKHVWMDAYVETATNFTGTSPAVSGIWWSLRRWQRCVCRLTSTRSASPCSSVIRRKT